MIFFKSTPTFSLRRLISFDIIVKDQTELSMYMDPFWSEKEGFSMQNEGFLWYMPATPPRVVFITWLGQEFEILYPELL